MRFLRYSLEKDKAIKAVLMIDSSIKQLNIRVVLLEDEGFYYKTGSSKKEKYCLYSDLLATSYGRGDEEAK